MCFHLLWHIFLAIYVYIYSKTVDLVKIWLLVLSSNPWFVIYIYIYNDCYCHYYYYYYGCYFCYLTLLWICALFVKLLAWQINVLSSPLLFSPLEVWGQPTIFVWYCLYLYIYRYIHGVHSHYVHTLHCLAWLTHIYIYTVIAVTDNCCRYSCCCCCWPQWCVNGINRLAGGVCLVICLLDKQMQGIN